MLDVLQANGDSLEIQQMARMSGAKLLTRLRLEIVGRDEQGTSPPQLEHSLLVRELGIRLRAYLVLLHPKGGVLFILPDLELGQPLHRFPVLLEEGVIGLKRAIVTHL